MVVHKNCCQRVKSRMPDAEDRHSCTFLTFIGSCGRSNPALFVGNFTMLFTGSYFAHFCHLSGLVRDPTQPCLLAILPGSLKSPDLCPPKRKLKVKTCHRFTIIFRWVNSAVWLSAPGIIFSVIFSLPNYFMVYFLSLGYFLPHFITPLTLPNVSAVHSGSKWDEHNSSRRQRSLQTWPERNIHHPPQ